MFVRWTLLSRIYTEFATGVVPSINFGENKFSNPLFYYIFILLCGGLNMNATVRSEAGGETA